MDQTLLIVKLVISGLLGLLIGIERELLIQKEKKEIAAGLRTFTLITLLGTLSSYISTHMIWFLPLMLSGIILLNLASYFATSKKSIGLTTEITMLIAFLIGSLVYYGEEKLAIAFTVLMVTLLSTRKISHNLIKKIKYSELLDALKFAIILFVILPFLPNKNFGPLGFFNPYQIWLMVVFVSGISYIGYILTKVLGPDKGIKITGIFGGLVSSTAVTSSMASKSKIMGKSIGPLVFATVAASSIMFIRTLLLIFVVNPVLSTKLIIPLLTMSFVGILGSLMIWRKEIKVGTEIELKSPFSLWPALKFGLFFTLILLISKLANLYLGEIGVYLTSIFSSLVDVTAITLSISAMAGNNISHQTGLISIFLAIISNTIVKFLIAYFSGDKKYSKQVGMIFLLMLLSGMISIFLF